MKVGILTPGYPPIAGGAANYTALLASNLAQNQIVETVNVFTEQYPGCERYSSEHGGKLVLHRKFSFRAGRGVRDWRSYRDYIGQNLSLAAIEHWLPKDVDALLVHAHFHYNPTLLNLGLKRVRHTRGQDLRMILDVRDPRMPRNKRSCIELYDAVICCSENSLAHVRSLFGSQKALHHVPIPFSPPRVEPEEASQICARHGLEKGTYLFGTDGVSLAKHVHVGLEAVQKLRARGHKISFVVAGRCRDWGPQFESAREAGDLVYIGSVPHHEAIAITANAAAHLNPSPIAGMPRASLEAMALGTRTVLPPNVPEFDKYVPDLVARTTTPDALADQVENILDRPPNDLRYPISRHYIENLIPAYLDIFEGKTPKLKN